MESAQTPATSSPELPFSLQPEEIALAYVFLASEAGSSFITTL